MKQLIIDVLWSQLDAMGAFHREDQTIDQSREAAGLRPTYGGWFRESVRLFKAVGYAEGHADRVIVRARPDRSVREQWLDWENEKARWLADADLAAGHPLLDACVRALPEILTGARPATDVMFPRGSMTLVQSAYKSNPMMRVLTEVLASRVVARVQEIAAAGEGRAASILEIGAGTGATTAVVLRSLRRSGLASAPYWYTDVSQAFLTHGEREYGREYTTLRFGLLDVEKAVRAQGFDVLAFDIVIAANVLHATRNIVETVRNVKTLLRPGGVVLLDEMAANSLYNHLTFGLLEGWWRYEDPELRMPGCPGLSSEGWRRVLAREGFRAISFPTAEAVDLGGQLIEAESDGVARLPGEERARSAIRSDPETSYDERLAASRAGTGAPAARKGPAAESSSAADRIESTLVSHFARALRIDAHRIRANEPFSTYGLDSILAVQLTRELNASLGVDLDITVMFEHDTVEALRAHISQEFPSAVSAGGPIADDDRRATEEVHRTEVDPSAAAANVRPGARPRGMAIIGMTGRFPTNRDLEGFWEDIEQGVTAIGSPPQAREDWSELAAARDVAAPMFRGAYLESVHDFDPQFFGLSMAEARRIPAEGRLILMAAWNALEDAGYSPSALGGRSTGVFVAVGPSGESAAGAGDGADEVASLLNPPLASLVPNRVSYHLNLTGPSEYCETTCSSSLVALHRAVSAIQAGECEQAIVAGANVIASAAGFAEMTRAGMLSPTGCVRPFQQGADGTVRGEGVGAVVVKPLDAALRDGDFVYAVILGTGVAHGGRGVSMTAPNVRGMRAAIEKAFQAAAVDPSSVSYVEAHGMSSMLADGAEIRALAASLGKASGERDDTDAALFVGSLKPYIGHTEVFSGMAALMKAVLAIRRGTIPAIPGFTRVSSEINLDGTRLRVNDANRSWPPRRHGTGGDIPRRACVNSFGIGGVNAHVVLEEATDEPRGSSEPSRPRLYVVSARDPEGLRARAKELLRWLDRRSGLSARELTDVSYTLGIGRDAMSHRWVAVAATQAELSAALRTLAADGADEKSAAVGTTESSAADEMCVMLSSSAGETVARALMREQRLEILGRAWANGANIDLRLLYEGEDRRRVPLPGYPFKRTICWTRPVGARDLSTSTVLNGGPADRLDPEEYVRALVGGVTGIDPTALDRSARMHALGLNSLLLLGLTNRLRRRYPAFQHDWLQPDDTVASVVSRLSSIVPHAARANSGMGSGNAPELVHLNDWLDGRPAFWVHGALGSVETFRSIAARSKRPFYGIQARGFASDDPPIEGISSMAEYYARIIRAVQPEGPYDLGGFCLGGIVSYEVARLLTLAGHTVRSLVMVDSPDNTGFTKTSVDPSLLSKNAALQIANTLLWPANEKDLASIYRRLIHKSDVDSRLSLDDMIERLAHLTAERGLGMAPRAVAAAIRQNLRVQLGYRVAEYVIEPLNAPVDCVYFRNRRGVFFGELEQYFTVAGEQFSLDHVNYWQDWERAIERLRFVDVDAASHMTILYEEEPLETIASVCADLYAA